MHPGNRLQPLCPQLSLQAFWPSGPLLPRCPGSGREEAELWVAGSRSRFLLCGWCPGGCECGLGYGSRLCSRSGAPSSAACGVFAREPPPTPDPGGEVDRGMEAGKRGRREPPDLIPRRTDPGKDRQPWQSALARVAPRLVLGLGIATRPRAALARGPGRWAGSSRGEENDVSGTAPRWLWAQVVTRAS